MNSTTRTVTDQRRQQPGRRQQPLPRHLRVRRSRTSGRLRLAVLAAIVVAIVVVVLGLPYARRVVQHFELPLQYSSIIRQQAQVNHVDAALIAAVIYAETRYQPRTSVTGAEGLMQIEPATAEALAKESGGTSFTVADLGEPQVNITYGTYYLRHLLREYHGSEALALAAYNGGETNVNNWISAARSKGQSFQIKDIPLGQTRAYVYEVLQKQKQYRERYPKELGYST